jgi:outer membrane protein OmpA-like peptidoglycan-associated protein
MRRLCLVLSFVLISFITHAQRYLGIAESNWSGTNSIYLNPANIADSRHKFVIDLFSVNFGVDNNSATLNTSNTISNFYKGDSLSFSSIFKFQPKDKFNLIAPYGELRLPGIMISLGRQQSIALTTRIRGFNQFANFNQSLYRTIVDEDFRNSTGDYSVSASNFNWTANLWSEIGLTYAGVLYEKGPHQLKGGFSVRYLSGIAYASMISNNLDISYNAVRDSLAVNKTDLKFASNIISNDQQLNSSFKNLDIASWLFGANGGHGFGGDVGLVYEYRPDYEDYTYDMDGVAGIKDRSRNKYKFRLSVAITDIGAINYNTNNKVVHFSGNGTISGNELQDSVKNYNDLVSYAQRRGFVIDSSSQAAKVHLPTAIIVGFDYKIYKRLYANFTYIGNLANRDVYGNSYYSQFTLAPRYDSKVFSVGVPFTYSFLTQNIKAGMGVRVGGFFMGSDDMLAFFSNNQYGVNFYFGAYIPINNKRPKDRDHDGVSNRKDKCPDVPGEWKFRGCPDPDRDHDGIPDSVDKCPDITGVPTAQGCPDKDLDSVADEQDRCPDQPGPVRLQGCPDRDHDGIPDIDDQCPDQPGPVKYHGCPDTDGDGIPDNIDKCPDVPGLQVFDGCPDTDGDGIPDNEDRCPTKPGPADNHGCPVIKTQVIEQIKKRLAFAATAIQFETGKSVIKKQSYPILDEIVGILNEYTDYYMTIDGHTDNVGNSERNMQLSKDRANAVRAYFISKGISADRLVANGYGDTQPVASNKTAAGRAKNRRVAMDLKLK